ncbi:DUF6543 domain-containing protein [Pseudomonas sp. dw_358]|uniref:dermonecrotic toxin domain-containing protein n=1 Tax=Pseudomonas sp. dw_358 TaxID=2720083 RepID=UPI001BD32582|nr:DUF6543 domain-containing protein [Pseudomonas sp. dw_358]
MSTTILGHDQAFWSDTARRWTQAFPDIHSLARDEALRILRRHTNRNLDPERVWWHRFDGAVSSPLTFTGWQHSGRPVQSMTFIQLLLQRYGARDQDSLDNLQVEGGFYTDGPEHGVYDQRNEVRLLAADVCAEFWSIDFAQRYRARLGAFWHQQGVSFVLLARMALRAAVLAARQRQALTAGDLGVLQALLEGRPAGTVYRLSLGGYLARDALRIATHGGRQLLYLPGEAQALQAFADHRAFYEWLRHCAAIPRERDALLRHFSSFNPARTSELDGLRELLEQVRQDTRLARLNVLQPRESALAGDPFAWLRRQAEQEMQHQADTLLTSNAHLRQGLWLGYLSAFINLGSGFAPLGWPVALVVVGAAAVSLALNVHKAVYAATRQERRDGIFGALNGAIVIAFNTPLLFELRLPETSSAEQSLDVLEQAPVVHPFEPLPGGQVNGLGLIERSDVKTLYCIHPLLRGADPAAVLASLTPLTETSGVRPMLQGPVLQAFATPRGALEYAQAEFDAAFVLHEIDAEGVMTASFRENFSHNQAALLRHLGEPADALHALQAAGRGLGEWSGGSWAFDEVHLAMDSLDRWQFLPVSTADLERLADPLHGRLSPPDSPGVLQGVQQLPVGFGCHLPRYSIEVQGVPRAVRYDPFSDTWRTSAGSAYRFDPLRGFVGVSVPDSLPPRVAVDIDRAVQQLGINVHLPWEVEPLPTAQVRPVPRQLHSVWLGRHMPRKLIRRVIHNAEEAGQGSQPFETHLYLDIKDPVELDSTLLRLARGPSTLKVHILEQTDFFKAFRTTRYYQQYLAASTGPAINYASAVDVLRYRLLYREGGIYMDVDDLIEGSGDGVPNFAEGAFEVAPGHLLLNNPVCHQRLRMQVDFNTSNFGSLPGNPLLEQMSEESYRRFLANTDLYKTRPYDFANTDAELNAYGQRISHVTGPKLFNEMIDRALPAYRQYRGLHHIARGQLHVPAPMREAIAEQLRAQARHYSALGGLIRIGSTGSWLST